jgi:hypothetical protein
MIEIGALESVPIGKGGKALKPMEIIDLYNQTGNFWLKYKDSGKHINDQPYTGKAAANAAALMLIRSNPEVKGNLLITAYGPGESRDVAEGNDHSLKKVWDRYAKHLEAGRGDHSDVRQIYKSGDILRNIRKYVKDHHGQKAVDDMERYAEKRIWGESVAEGKYDRDDYYNARQGREYGRDLTPTGYGGDGSGTRRDDIFKGQSEKLPADPFSRTTGSIPKSKTGRVHKIVLPGEMDEGYTVTRGIDTERYQARDGLEGPFSAKNGKVVYYDKREGKYYDPDTDMYIEHDEWQAMNEAEYQGRKVELNKPMAGDVAKSKVYVKNPETGKVVKVNFGDKNMRIKKSNPNRRKSFRARHNCENPGPKTKARYWSCRAW